MENLTDFTLFLHCLKVYHIQRAMSIWTLRLEGLTDTGVLNYTDENNIRTIFYLDFTQISLDLYIIALI